MNVFHLVSLFGCMTSLQKSRPNVNKSLVSIRHEFLNFKVKLFFSFLMNEKNLKICEDILRDFLRLPASKLIWDNKVNCFGETLDIRTTLSDISLKVQRNEYTSVSEFMEETTEVITTARSKKNKVPIVVALCDDMIKELNKIYVYYADITAKRKEHEEKIRSLYEEWYKHKSPESEGDQSVKPQKVTFGSHMLNKDPATFTAHDFTVLINIIKVPDIITRIAAFIYFIQPEAISLTDSISIHTSLLKEENIPKIAEYAQVLLKEAAIRDMV
ncbi:hypothetical protein TVAG_361940 [Trichomonas vaginalis G3]|uniref:Bromo domain-containing protein n=1 Tax=Trichomonas vaginalis (strain ATCC PRA-98 / G3) TaxID=412133 RepID=A2FRB2_TRIV3|nr:hypothetical protein TVAGG3_0449210 [Trichomonas vaginalis G3]EAX92553.1 hypothetical protein TVAG_361940 [Trichomonas vaginalis G3]KAI5538036.1 hypothetical protein TVAGG3_0449210 [Trichomonas vaginalis G3]|eukprot:XP_001305483.1 hypothetical protein [Trichomonas vaginalis G3]